MQRKLYVINNKKLAICALLLVMSCGTVVAQDRLQLTDSATIDYLQKSGNYSTLYYGSEYETQPATTNHPYLVDAQYTKARLSYQDVIYPDVLLRLDLNRDELIVRTPDFRHIVLFPENTGFAELHGKHIVYFQKNNLPGCPPTGYYILLYSGDCLVLEKRYARLAEKIYQRRLERFFIFSTRYYLYKEGVYYTVKNKKELLKTLHPYTKELKRFVSNLKLNFKEETEMFLMLTVSEYEKLSGL